MAIQTIEDALQEMGRTLAQPAMVQRARNAVNNGDTLEITVLVSPDKQGFVVSIHSLIASDRTSHGRLIRLK